MDTQKTPAPTMRAIVQRRYGSTDVFKLENIDTPSISSNEVLVKVAAAGMDRGTWHLMSGLPYLLRIIGFGFSAPKNLVAGRDVSGTVAAVGDDVTRFKPGDDVFGISRGAFAEYAPAREDKLVRKPTNLTFEQAAAVSISGITALQGLRDEGGVKAGQKVLIIGASGGVGSYAVQLAKAMGAEVTGVASTAKLELVRSLGADHMVDYTREDFADGHLYDVILDVGGNSSLRHLRRALTPKGTLVIVGGEGKGKVTGGLGRQLRAVILSSFVGQRLRMQTTKENHDDLEVLHDFIQGGQVSPSIDKTYSLVEVPQAMRHLEAGRVRGKIAIAI